MLVYVTGAENRITVEDTGFFLDFRPFEGEPGRIEVDVRPPGTPPPTFDVGVRVDARGCLGAVRMKGFTFLAIVIPPVSSVGCEDEEVEQIREVLFYCLEGHHLPLARTPAHPCYHLRKVLTDGAFYYSKTFDLSSRLATRIKAQEQLTEACIPIARADAPGPAPSPSFHKGTREFVWNTFILKPLRALRNSLNPQIQSAFDSRSFILPVIQGYYGAAEVKLGSEKVMMAVISRRGWARAGTRFLKRGIDDAGNVANFAETETILQTKDKTLSFVQVRGSVPLLWSEVPHWHGPVELHLAEPVDAVSLPPLLSHFRYLVDEYSKVHIYNLLSDLPTGSLAAEALLGQAYSAILGLAQAKDPNLADKVVYEAHSIHKDEMMSGGLARVPSIIALDLEPHVTEFGATIAGIDPTSGKYILTSPQKGAFRVNCRDCLDRSNLGEFSISAAMLEQQCPKLGLGPFQGSTLEILHRKLFADSGDALAEIYAGSATMSSSFVRTGKTTARQMAENAANSEKREIQSVLHDKDKNRATEILTGQYRNREQPPVFVVKAPPRGCKTAPRLRLF
ncbi:phosphatidylinositol phosphate phosphatase [Rhodotorula toruloides]|uniref:Phosphatidylinositol phosphate phosphatase n=1 Tax=Rhodotorula toruloides TaxID=5286 RepID=A0A511KH04_RHOTO|nr:phosphatidylinositol phosphate phosphatase [Rhodotorula toruloides]